MNEKIVIIIAAVLAAACICVIVYFVRREHRLLNSIQKMLDDAVGGTFKDVHLDESKMSAAENSMWRYLSDTRMAVRKLSEEKEQIQSLISDISHQAAAPIANIMLYSQLLEENQSASQGECGQDARAEAAVIREQTEKLEFLINLLLKISRMETGIIRVYPQRQPVEPVLAAVKNQFRQRADGKNIQFTVEETKETAVFDLKWTIEALANIVDNAVKYTPYGGSVSIQVESYSFFVRIDIKDNGVGIPEEEQANVFGRFYRAKAVSEESGLGIGLYLAREVMEAQNGYVKLISKAGEGSTFSLFLLKEEMSQK